MYSGHESDSLERQTVSFLSLCAFQAVGAKLTIYLAAVIGAITATGSVTAFAKLQVMGFPKQWLF